MDAKLLAISGPLRKSEFLLTDRVTIGSAEENAIRLEGPAISPEHCRIFAEGDRFLLMDLQSCSGTFVNGIPIKQRELSGGDEVTVGNSVFLFRAEKQRVAGGSRVQLHERETAG